MGNWREGHSGKRGGNQGWLTVTGTEIPPDGYFSFGRNPHLSQLVRSFAHTIQGELDSYNVAPFEEPVVDRSSNPAYDMHLYWAKKPHGAIEKYILHFTQPGDVVFDPMCGSGGTGSVALRLGRRAVLIDISPAATFIAKHLVTRIDPERLRQAYAELYSIVSDEVDWLYATKCDRCRGLAWSAFLVHSQTYRCIKCMAEVALFDCSDSSGCPHCGEPIKTRQERLGYVPVECAYVCNGGCKPNRSRRRHNDADRSKARYFREYDLAKIEEISAKEIPYWYPTDSFPTEWVSWRPNLREAGNVSGFFTKRNLWAAAMIADAATKIKDTDCGSWLLFTLTATLMNISKKAQHLEEGGGYIPGNYTFPPMIKERNVLRSYQSVADKVLDGVRYTWSTYKSQQVAISTQSALDMKEIPTGSIDYIFTDPPYSNKVPFGEFNFIWEVWLRQGLSWKSEEVIVNEKLGKGFHEWKLMMVRFLEECYRVLKPGRWMSVCYHDSAEGSWSLLQDAFGEVGFISDNLGKVLSIERELKSFKQRTTSKVQMRDLVINFRKPRIDECSGSYRDVAISGDEDSGTFSEKVLTIIRGHLEQHPGSTRDRIYDEVVSRLVREGEMQPHRFDELLNQVAENPGPDRTRWFLKDGEEDVRDTAESLKEEAAAEVLSLFIKKRIMKDQEEGVHYSDLLEQYLYAVKEKPRLPLIDLIADYFYRTEEGTWRLPLSKQEEELKARSRAAGTNRRIKRFAATLSSGAAVPMDKIPPPATLVEWIRHAKRTGLFEVGKLLYERGGLDASKLSEEMATGVEEDYQVCVRMLARGVGSPAAKSKRSR